MGRAKVGDPPPANRANPPTTQPCGASNFLVRVAKRALAPFDELSNTNLSVRGRPPGCAAPLPGYLVAWLPGLGRRTVAWLAVACLPPGCLPLYSTVQYCTVLYSRWSWGGPGVVPGDSRSVLGNFWWILGGPGGRTKKVAFPR